VTSSIAEVTSASIAKVTSANARHAASAKTSHVGSAEATHVTSAETAHVTSSAKAAAPVSTATTATTATATTAAAAACLCTRRKQRPGKQGGCQYHHRSSSSHEIFLSRAEPSVIIRTSRPSLIWSPGSEWLTGNFEVSNRSSRWYWHQRRKGRCRSAAQDR
jgi:hypothetical protein